VLPLLLFLLSGCSSEDDISLQLDNPDIDTELYNALSMAGVSKKDMDRGDVTGVGRDNKQITTEELRRTALDLYAAHPREEKYNAIVTTTFSNLSNRYFEKAEKIRNGNPDPWKPCLDGSGDAYEKAYNFSQTNTDALFWMGKCAYYPATAENYFSRFLQAHPGEVNALHELGLSLFLQGKDEAAVKAFNEVLQEDPLDSETYFRKAIVFLKSDPKEAINNLQWAVTCEPIHDRARLSLALLFDETGDSAEAANQLEYLDPSDDTLSEEMLDLYHFYLGKLIRIPEHIIYDPLIEDGLKQSISQLRQEAEASIQNNSGDAEAYYKLGMLQGFLYESVPPNDFFKTAVDLNPHLKEARIALVFRLVKENRYQEALKVLDAAPTPNKFETILYGRVRNYVLQQDKESSSKGH
jgi:hypothetical protein